MSLLFEPLQVGELTLPNRIIMAPLTRQRASEGRVPNDLMVEYYVQRAGAGLILTEATSVTPQGVGYADTPGLWSQEQVKGWRKVTSAVHEAGGRIFAQLWHVGRISDPIFLNGELPVAPSAIAAGGHVSHVRPQRGYVVPRALETDEIPGIVEAYRRGAQPVSYTHLAPCRVSASATGSRVSSSTSGAMAAAPPRRMPGRTPAWRAAGVRAATRSWSRTAQACASCGQCGRSASSGRQRR